MLVVSEYQPEYFPEHDKKNLSLQHPTQQPDLTQTVVGVSVPPCYEYPYSDPPKLSRSCSEHHYDVPHLSSPPGDPPTSPSTSSHSMDSSSCPVTATPPAETSSEKHLNSDSNHSISSYCSSCEWDEDLASCQNAASLLSADFRSLLRIGLNFVYNTTLHRMSETSWVKHYRW